jgi:hypothetical protein
LKGPSPRISAIAPRSLRSFDGSRYDVALASLGYETRSRQLPGAIGTPRRALAIPFTDRCVLDYEKNRAWFEEHGWELRAVGDGEIAEWTRSWLAELGAERADPVRVAVDVSSMSRLRIAAVIEATLSLPQGTRAEVDLLYTPARFQTPQIDDDPQVFEVAPVSDFFAGWWTDLEAPLVAVIGVGYELEMAATAIDKLEPADTIVFVPAGEDPRYAPEVEEANHALLLHRGVGRPTHEYAVSDPFGCFCMLEATLSKLAPHFRAAMVPLGPKIYAACAMLAAGLHGETSQVIRVTAGERQKPINRSSNGHVCGLRVLVSPRRGYAGDGEG